MQDAEVDFEPAAFELAFEHAFVAVAEHNTTEAAFEPLAGLLIKLVEFEL